MTNFIINSDKCYFYLNNDVAELLNVDDLAGCMVFDNFNDFYKGVNALFPDIDDENVLHGSYIELYLDGDKVVVDHAFLEGECDSKDVAHWISNYAGE